MDSRFVLITRGTGGLGLSVPPITSLQRMRENGYGRIVTVGSRSAAQPGANLAVYSAPPMRPEICAARRFPSMARFSSPRTHPLL